MSRNRAQNHDGRAPETRLAKKNLWGILQQIADEEGVEVNSIRRRRKRKHLPTLERIKVLVEERNRQAEHDQNRVEQLEREIAQAIEKC